MFQVLMKKITFFNILLLLSTAFIYYKSNFYFPNEKLETHSTNIDLTCECFSKLTQKLPGALIVGVEKCGSGTLLQFIATHPNVVGDGYREVGYFSQDINYKRGDEWYRHQMPFSNENQITIEKTPSYFNENNSSKRIYKFNPKMKIIITVCDPVIRAVSVFLQLQVTEIEYRRTMPSWKSVYKWNIKNLNDSEKFKKSLYGDSKNNTIIPDVQNQYIFRSGFYYNHILDWLKYFPREQILFINGERFKKEPFIEIDKLQAFLKIRPIIKKEHFVYNQTKGFFCLRNPSTSKVKCMSSSDKRHDKGRKHPKIDQNVIDYLRKIYKLSNQKFFKFLNETPWWPIE
jgi:[heparan sulfate]-glucosamine 3-sulfotransferase 5